MKKHIILIGFMGSGKSTVGAALAQKLDLPLHECDAEVERRCGSTIAELIDTQGEPAFRKLERESLQALVEAEPGVISTGGGIISNPEGRELLSTLDTAVVWLKIDFAATEQRVNNDPTNNRPLFRNVKTAQELFEQRQEYYKNAASITVDATQPVEVIVEAIMREIKA